MNDRKWPHKTEIRQERWHIKKNEIIRVFECFSFNSILEYREIGKILPKCILFLQNMILNKAFHTIIDKFYLIFKEFCCLWVLSCLHEFEMRFSKKNLLHQLKQQAHGPHCSPEKQVQINTYDYIISLIERNYFLCENWMVIVLHLTKLESPSPKGDLCQVWLKSVQ